MRPFRWAFVLASLFMIHGWLVDHHEELNSWAASSSAVDVLIKAAQAMLAGPSAVVVGLFARVADKDVLANANRRRIREFIECNPGACLSEIAQAMGIGWGTVVHHVARLESARLVRSYADGRRRGFLAEGHSATMGDPPLPRSDPARERLLKAIHETPGLSQGRLAERAGLSLSMANRHLVVLERAGFVASSKQWRTRTYGPASRGQTSPAEQLAGATLSGVSPRGTSAE